MKKSKLAKITGTGLLLLFLLVMPYVIFAQTSLTDTSFKDLQDQADAMEKRQQMLEKDWQELVEIEAGILRHKARAKGSQWYREGVEDYEREEFAIFSQRLHLLHQIERKDYSVVDDLYPMLAKSIFGLAITYKGKVAKDDILSSASMRSIERENFRRQLMGNLSGTYMSALAEPTPELARQKMEAIAEFINSMASSERELVELEAEKADREFDYFLTSLIPGVGTAMALTEVYQGTNALGKKMTWVDNALGLFAVVGVVGDVSMVAGTVKMAGKFPAKSGHILNLLYGHIKDLTPAERVFINSKYPGGMTRLEKLGEALKYLRTPIGNETTKVIDSIDPLGMHIAREAMEEQNSVTTTLSKMSPEKLENLQTAAKSAVEKETPALDLAKLADSSTMTEPDFKDFQKSFGLGDDEMQLMRNDPILITKKVEEITGIPFDNLRSQSDAFREGEFAVMRNANKEGLHALKKGEALPKPLFIKGNTGAGGSIFTDQEFSKISKALDEAEATGNTALATELRKQITTNNALVESVTHEKELSGLRKSMQEAASAGKAEQAAKINKEIDLIENTRQAETSSKINGKTILAALVEDADGNKVRTAVLRDHDGNLFNIATRKPLTAKASILKNTDGSDKVLSHITDKKTGKFFVGDQDAHILGFKSSQGDGLISEDVIGGMLSNTEKRRTVEIALEQKQAGYTPMMVHGAQVRYYAKSLKVDKAFYVIEHGKLRIVRNNEEQLQELVHLHRLEGNVTTVDPRWGWGKWTPAAGFEK